MPRRLLSFLIVWLLAISDFGNAAPQAKAETPVGSNVDHRVIVAMKAPTFGVESFLPKGWISVPFPDGPVKGANILFVFADSLIQLDAEGRPLVSPTRRALVLVGLGQPPNGGAVQLNVLRIFSTTPEIDPYSVSVPARIARRTLLRGTSKGTRRSEDHWKIETAAGGVLEFGLEYLPGTRIWGPDFVTPHSASNPDFSRIYRINQLVDLVESKPMGKTGSSKLRLDSDLPDLAKVLNGTQEIIAVMDIPIYVRKISLP